MSNTVVVGRVASRAHKTKLLVIILIFLVISSLAEAQTQGHPFSQIYYVDTNINISGFNITNVSYLGIGTISPAYPLDVAGTGRITNNLYVGGNLGIGTVSPQNALNVIGDINATGTIYGTLGSDTVNTTSIIDLAVTDAKISEVNWTKLNGYPSACGPGEAVQGIDDTLLCVNLSAVYENISGNLSGSGTPNYIPLWIDASSLGNSYIYQSGGLIYTTSGLVLGGNIDMQSSYSLINATFVNATNIYAGGNAVLTTATTFGGNITGNQANLQLEPGSVGASQILNGSITSAKLVPDLSLSWANLTSYPADCPGGYFVTGANDTDFKCALSDNVQVAGNANYVAKFNGTNALISSIIYDNGTNIGIGLGASVAAIRTLDVVGDINATVGIYGVDIYQNGNRVLDNTSAISTYNSSYHNFWASNISAKTDYVNNATERALFLSTYNGSYVQLGGDLSGTVTAPTVRNTQGLTWGNLTSWNLGVAWTGSLAWGNISGYTLTGNNITVTNTSGAYIITLPNPSATTKGGVVSLACSGTDKIISIGTNGVPVCGSDVNTYNTTAQMINAVNNTAINILGNAATVTDGLYTTTLFTGNITGLWNALQLADGSVNSAKIIDGSIASGDLASDLSSLNKVSAGELTAATNMVTVTNDLKVNGNFYIIGNISNVGVQTINVNGSAIPFFANTFDIGSFTNTWRYGYFATDVLIGGKSVLKNDTSFTGNVTGNWNALQLADGSVNSAKIIDGTIAAADLATTIILSSGQTINTGPGTINASQLNGQAASYYLNIGTVFGGNVSGTYGAIQLASGSVGASQIINGAINSSKLVSDLNLGWANLTGYPNNCVAGQAIQSLGDSSFTCVALNSTSGNVSGAGTQNYVAKFNGTNALISSIIYDNGTNIGIGTAQPNSTLHVAGNITVTPGSDVCIDGGNCLSSMTSSFFYGKTAVLYTANLSAGSLTGYTAGNAICNASFSGTHLCSISEISYTISTRNLSEISGWTGEAWIATGPAKYSPASLPVTDCNGFTYGAAGSYLGNWWSFNQSTGGVGKTGQCGNTLSLGCCK